MVEFTYRNHSDYNEEDYGPSRDSLTPPKAFEPHVVVEAKVDVHADTEPVISSVNEGFMKIMGRYGSSRRLGEYRKAQVDIADDVSEFSEDSRERRIALLRKIVREAVIVEGKKWAEFSYVNSNQMDVNAKIVLRGKYFLVWEWADNGGMREGVEVYVDGNNGIIKSAKFKSLDLSTNVQREENLDLLIVSREIDRILSEYEEIMQLSR